MNVLGFGCEKQSKQGSFGAQRAGGWANQGGMTHDPEGEDGRYGRYIFTFETTFHYTKLIGCWLIILVNRMLVNTRIRIMLLNRDPYNGLL